MHRRQLLDRLWTHDTVSLSLNGGFKNAEKVIKEEGWGLAN